MTARRTLLLGGLLVAALAAGGWYWHTHLRAPRWNVLLITLSGARADHLGAYGRASARTPAIDSLAARGVLFERVVAAAPVSLPSHASLLTGRHPLEHGLLTGGQGRLPDEARTLAEVLSDHGYVSGAFTTAYGLDSRFGLDQGYDVYDDFLGGTKRGRDNLYVERPADAAVDDALSWLQHVSAEPFHCWIQLNEPQLPYEPHPVDGADPFADSPYDGEIACADRQIARILEYLDKQQLTQRTLIVVTGDHGAGLGEHGEQGSGLLLHDSTVHVPLIIAAPGGIGAARVPGLISQVDFLPTVLGLVDLAPPPSLAGVSLAASMYGGSPPPPRACLSMTAEPLLDYGWSPLSALTTDDWKYVRSTVPELYDRRADPGETANLAAAQPDRVAELEQQLKQLESQLHPGSGAESLLAGARERAAAWLSDRTAEDTGAGSTAVVLPDAKDNLALVDKHRAAMQLVHNNKAAEAEPLLRELAASNPQFVKAWSLLGECLAALQQTEEAIDCYQKALQFDPHDINTLLNLAAAQSVTHRGEDCIATYKRAIAADPDSPVPPHYLGLLYLQQGDQYQAEVLYAQSVQRDPTYDPVICSQGDLAIQQGDGLRAVERYDAALAVNPRSVNAILNLGVYAARSQEYGEAERYFKHAVEVAPNDPLALQSLARIAMFRGRTQETVEAFQSILVDHPDHYSTIISLGWLHAAHPDDKVRNVERALDLADRTVALAGADSAEALDLLAGALANAGRFEEALATIDKAIAIARDIPGYPLKEMELRRSLYADGKPYRSTLTETSPAGGP